VIAWWPVSSRSLRKRTLQGNAGRLSRAALFPLFDQSGQVRQVMVVAPDSSRLLFFDPGEAAPIVPLWGTIRFRRQFSWRADDDLSGAEPLWHFDPDWMLRDSRFESSEMAPLIRATNCAGKFKQRIKFVYFRRDLMRVRWVTNRSSDGWQLIRYNPDLLPPPPSQPRRARKRPAGWTLSPFWMK
jgi:hypothetical protein